MTITGISVSNKTGEVKVPAALHHMAGLSFVSQGLNVHSSFLPQRFSCVWWTITVYVTQDT